MDIGIHRGAVLLPGYYEGVVPRKATYWAHVSGGAKDRLPGGKCSHFMSTIILGDTNTQGMPRAECRK